jgi:hypothetical protein
VNGRPRSEEGPPVTGPLPPSAAMSYVPPRRARIAGGRRTVKYLEMTDEDRRRQEQRRADRPVVRRSARTAVAAAGVLTAVVLGWCTAVGVGLTTAGHVPEAGMAPAPSAETDWAEPAMRRTLSGPARPARPTTQTPTRPAEPPAVAATTVPPAPTPAPVPTPAPPPRPAPPVTLAAASPAPVRKGEPCPVAGATGVTRGGAAMVCTASPGNDRTRWRAAKRRAAPCRPGGRRAVVPGRSPTVRRRAHGRCRRRSSSRTAGGRRA